MIPVRDAPNRAGHLVLVTGSQKGALLERKSANVSNFLGTPRALVQVRGPVPLLPAVGVLAPQPVTLPPADFSFRVRSVRPPPFGFLTSCIFLARFATCG